MESQTTHQTAAGVDDQERAILTLIAEQIHSIDTLSRETPIETLDIDSLDMVEIAQTVFDDFGIRIDALSLHEAITLGDVLDAVSAAGAGR